MNSITLKDVARAVVQASVWVLSVILIMVAVKILFNTIR